MRINRAAIKANAKHAIRQSRPHAVLVTLVYAVILWCLDLLVTNLMGLAAYQKMLLAALASGGELPVWDVVIHVSALGVLLSIAISIMSFMLGVGFTIYAMNTARFRQAAFGNLFDGFGSFFRILWLGILLWLFVFLWSLLFIIPGIIAAYRYRMALYILLDNPHMGALDCIRASRQMMHGRKGELFVLDLSFILWYLLTIIPFVTIWVTPYVEITNVYYYEAIRAPQGGYQSWQDQTGDNWQQGGGKPPWEY